MKRLLTRTLLTLFTLSALSCLILLPLSHHRRLYVGWQRLEQGTYPDNHAVELFVTDGSLAFDFIARDTFWLSDFQLTPPDWWDRRGLYAGADAARPISSFSPPEAFTRLGVHLHYERQPVGARRVTLQQTTIALPLWLLFLLSATPPAIACRRQRRRRATRTSHCPDCGYDLRATPDRCPECGRNIPTPSATIPA
jgi:hypothetical protein